MLAVEVRRLAMLLQVCGLFALVHFAILEESRAIDARAMSDRSQKRAVLRRSPVTTEVACLGPRFFRPVFETCRRCPRAPEHRGDRVDARALRDELFELDASERETRATESFPLRARALKSGLRAFADASQLLFGDPAKHAQQEVTHRAGHLEPTIAHADRGDAARVEPSN